MSSASADSPPDPSPYALTRRQAQILEFMIETLLADHRMPSTRDIMARFGFTSPNGANGHLRLMEAKGYLRRREPPQGRRSIAVPFRILRWPTGEPFLLRAEKGAPPEGTLKLPPRGRAAKRTRGRPDTP